MKILPYASDFCMLLAFITTLVRWRYLKGASLLLGIQTLLAFPTDVTGWIMGQYNIANFWFYNVYMLPDCLLVATAAWALIKNKVAAGILLAAMALFTVAWGINFAQRPDTFATGIFMAECLLVLVAYLYVITDRIASDGKGLARPLIWLCFIQIVYYACQLPLFMVLGYLIKNDLSLASKVYMINPVLNIIRYSLTAFCFWSLIKPPVAMPGKPAL
ncbi:MAG: hypothetical protein EOP49_08300 [Sphingobacteriales bacterium]|nr:MAG: hypothetical protein EOP49_08300 [Sphingobacteriales bacterium]